MSPSDDKTPRYKTYRSRPTSARRRSRDKELMSGVHGAADGYQPPAPQPAEKPKKGRAARVHTARPRSRRSTLRRIAIWSGLLVTAVVIGFGIWFYLGFRQVDEAVARSNARISPETEAALTPDSGSIFSTPTTILILGVDKRGNDPGRSDSMMLMRSNPNTKTFAQLSIARDMWVDIPGQGMGKINTAYFYGGLPLAIETVERFTGVPINHVILVKLNMFPKLIDAVGGVDVNVPKDISSWYSGGQTVTFEKGVNHMDGTRAMIYSRIRAVDDDFHRQERQQQVLKALQQKLTSASSFWRFGSLGNEVMSSFTTDLTTWELAQLMWRKYRAGDTHGAIMQGTPAYEGGQSVVISDKAANLQLIDEFLSY